MDRRVYIRPLLRRRQGGGGPLPSDDDVRGANGSRFDSDLFQGAAQTSSQITLCGG